jgi:hypothetical protein
MNNTLARLYASITPILLACCSRDVRLRHDSTAFHRVAQFTAQSRRIGTLPGTLEDRIQCSFAQRLPSRWKETSYSQVIEEEVRQECAAHQLEAYLRFNGCRI